MSVKRRILLIVGLLIAIPYGAYWYSSTHPLSNKQFGFQYYKPTSLPDGFKITAKRIDILKPGGKLYYIGAEMNLRTEDWVYSIQEGRPQDGDTPQLTTKLTNYDINSVGVTCKQMISPAKQSYRLCHWLDFGKISVYDVKFIKNGTFISSEFPTTKGKLVPQSQISTYVDSFVKARASGFTTLQSGGA